MTKRRSLLEPLMRGSAVHLPEVVYHEVIGLHDVNVLKVEDAGGVVSWLKGYIVSKGWPKPSLTVVKKVETIARDYVNRGFAYFSFDLISLSSRVKAVEPLLYRFKSPTIYYPLKISRLAKGYARITLYVITEDRIKPETTWGTGLKIVFEDKVPLSEVEGVDARLAELFTSDVWITVMERYGRLSDLNEDLQASTGSSLEHVKPYIFAAVPIIASLAIISASYAYAYRRVKRG